MTQVAGAELATRSVHWNVTPAMLVFLYASMVVALAVFTWGCWRHAQVWRIGRPEMRRDRPMARVRRLFVHAGLQTAVARDRLMGIAHAALYLGVAALFAATLVVMVHHDLGIEIMQGRFYLYLQSLTVNILSAFALVAVAALAAIRFVRRPARLECSRPADAAILATIALILVSGFVMSGVRIVATADPWGSWRPVSAGVGRLATTLWRSDEALMSAHRWLWMGHAGLWHLALALIPFSKMRHVVTSSANIYFAPLEKVPLPRIDFETMTGTETLGVRTPHDLTWKQLLDLDACTECGRCQDVCPAWAEQKPLSPKRLILDLRDHVRERRSALLDAHALREVDGDRYTELLGAEPPIPGGVIREETIWACTTCGACEAACPVSIEHVRLVLQLRQNLAMEQGSAPEGIVEMVSNLETRGHPWRGVAVGRTAWYSLDPDRSVDP